MATHAALSIDHDRVTIEALLLLISADVTRDDLLLVDVLCGDIGDDLGSKDELLPLLLRICSCSQFE